jgi:hypothetical protein
MARRHVLPHLAQGEQIDFLSYYIQKKPIIIYFAFLLTKMEVGLAAVASAILGNALIIWTQKPRLSQGLALISTFLLAMLIPIVGCLAFLSRYMPLKEVFQCVSFSWACNFRDPCDMERILP